MADCCCSCCPPGMLAVITMTTGGGGGGGSMHQLAMGGTEGGVALFYLCWHRFSRQTKEPTLLTMEGTALKSSGATVLASSPAKPPSISKAFLPRWLTVRRGGLSGRLHAWTKAASDEAAGSCSNWGCWQRTPKGCWSGPSRRRGMGADTALLGCGRSCSGGGTLLTLLLTVTTGAPATDSCCTVPCCHGEGVWANEAAIRTWQSWCPSQQQQQVTASRWGRGGGGGPWRMWRRDRRLSAGHYRLGILACPSGRPGTCPWGSWTGRCK